MVAFTQDALPLPLPFAALPPASAGYDRLLRNPRGTGASQSRPRGRRPADPPAHGAAGARTRVPPRAAGGPEPRGMAADRLDRLPAAGGRDWASGGRERGGTPD